jgi:hypothetical protein
MVISGTKYSRVVAWSGTSSSVEALQHELPFFLHFEWNETTASDSAPILPGAFRLRGAQAWGSII